jgi:hypothetical protein
MEMALRMSRCSSRWVIDLSSCGHPPLRRQAASGMPPPTVRRANALRDNRTASRLEGGRQPSVQAGTCRPRRRVHPPPRPLGDATPRRERNRCNADRGRWNGERGPRSGDREPCSVTASPCSGDRDPCSRERGSCDRGRTSCSRGGGHCIGDRGSRDGGRTPRTRNPGSCTDDAVPAPEDAGSGTRIAVPAAEAAVPAAGGERPAAASAVPAPEAAIPAPEAAIPAPRPRSRSTGAPRALRKGQRSSRLPGNRPRRFRLGLLATSAGEGGDGSPISTTTVAGRASPVVAGALFDPHGAGFA